MNIRIRSAATLLSAGLAFSTGATAANSNGNGSLLPFVASYTFNYKGMNAGVTTLSLARTDDHWTYRSTGEPSGLFKLLPIDNPTQTSEMRVAATGVQPLRFRQTNGSGSDHAIDIRFDWDTNHVLGTVENKPVDEQIPADTQDDLSVQIALTTAMARGQDSGTLHTYGDRGLREYRYRADGEELLHTAIGDVATRIYVTERSGSPRTTRYWCAPSYGYLPLRVQQKRLNELEWTLEVRSLNRG